MDNKRVYIIYRKFNKKEQQIHDIKYRFYGWSPNKSVAKAFVSQRSKGKYAIYKTFMNKDTMYSEDGHELYNENMINFIRLKSVKYDGEFDIFMTADEMQEAEKRIQRYFRELCSISSIPGNYDYLSMITHLDDYYAMALDFIGYRPPEISAMYPSADFRDDPGEIMGIDELIEEAYSGSVISPSENYTNPTTLPGLSMLNDVASKVLYSVESFIKVLREDF